MTNETILKKAIEKVGLPTDGYYGNEYYSIIFSHDFAKAFWGEKRKMCVECLMVSGEKFEQNMPVTEYDDDCETSKHSYKKVSGWQYHLQQMVLEEEPLKYIEKFL